MKNIFNLTPRELEVLKLYDIGRNSKAISKELGISFRTVETHNQNFRVKLYDAKNVRVALHTARKHGLLD